MGDGILPDSTLSLMVDAACDVPGDFAEVGVYRGATFRRLVPLAVAQGKTAHAFDSFIGMADPSEHDGPGYRRGSLSAGGPEVFLAEMIAAGLSPGAFRIWPGFVPECLLRCPVERWSLVYIDLDHHDPTEHAIRWAWPRLAPGGVLAFDDYFPGREIFASPPIGRFLVEHGGEVERLRFDNNQLVLRRLDG